MSQDPAVTIGIMTHNYGRYIGEAIDSVLAQSRTDWELIISDDASTDETQQIIAPYLKDPRIVSVRHSENLGQSANWRFLLEQGTAPVIAVLHADDAWLPHTLEMALSAFSRDPAINLVAGNWFRQTEGKPLELSALNKDETTSGHTMYRRQLTHFTFLPSGTFLSRHTVRQAGMPRLDLKMVVDFEYLLRVLMHTRHACTLSEPLFVYRLHAGSTTNVTFNNGAFDSEVVRVLEMFKETLTAFPTLQNSLPVLRRQNGWTLFRHGLAHAAHGNRKAGLSLMQQGINLSPLLLINPRTLGAFMLCGLGGSAYKLLQKSLSHHLASEAQAD